MSNPIKLNKIGRITNMISRFCRSKLISVATINHKSIYKQGNDQTLPTFSEIKYQEENFMVIPIKESK